MLPELTLKQKLLAGAAGLALLFVGSLFGGSTDKAAERGCEAAFAQLIPFPISCKVIDGKLNALLPDGRAVPIE